MRQARAPGAVKLAVGGQQPSSRACYLLSCARRKRRITATALQICLQQATVGMFLFLCPMEELKPSFNKKNQPTLRQSVLKHLLYTLKIKFNWYHRKSLRHRHYPTYLSLPPIQTENQRRKKKSNLVPALLPLVTYCIFAFHFISEPIHHSRLGQDGGFVIFTMLPFPHVIWASNNNNAPNKHQDECRCIRINPIKKTCAAFTT